MLSPAVDSLHTRTRSSVSLARGAIGLACLVVSVLVVPLVIRVANWEHGEKRLPPTYLPALEGPRERLDFDVSPIHELVSTKPRYVFIGDSMTGTRIDEGRLGQLAGRPVKTLLQAGSGSAFWYLALKNWVIGSASQPRAVFILFRDTNLTDVLFRLDETFRWSIDKVAHDREEELNAVIAKRVSTPTRQLARTVERMYQGDRGRSWIEPALVGWPTRVLMKTRRRRDDFVVHMNERFGLDHLRKFEAADVAATDDADADFPRFVDRSVLPLMLRDARAAGITLCLVRVQRRPAGGRPPAESAAMQRYVRDLRAYIESHGGVFHDETGDPALTLDMYEDGDHLAREARGRYTEIFFDRLRPLFQ
jgi:hypothetical protein